MAGDTGMKSILMFIYNLLGWGQKKIRQHSSFETIYYVNKSGTKVALYGMGVLKDEVAREILKRNLPKERKGK